MKLSPNVEAWLLADSPQPAAKFPGTEPESDPSVRVRVFEEVLDRRSDDPELRAAREQATSKGWAASILGLQQPPGQWDAPGTSSRELYVPKYIATNWRLLVLSDLGITRNDPRIAKAVELLFAAEGPDGGLGGKESEVCFTGNALRMLARFGYLDDARVEPIVSWLLKTQKADGGWHCFPGGDQGTLDCWEALAAFAAIPRDRWTASVKRSVERGAEFYLERELLHEGETPYAPWSRLHYPVHYYYDLLVGLDTLTRLGFGDDSRLRSALDLLEGQRRPEGVWWMDAVHPDIPAGEEYQPRLPVYPFVLEYPGRPSRVITSTALAVLHRTARL